MSIMATRPLVLVSLLAFLVTSAAASPGGESDGEKGGALQDQQQQSERGFIRCVRVSNGTLDCKALSGKGTLATCTLADSVYESDP